MVGVSVAYPHDPDRVADWEMQPAALPSITRVYHTTYHQPRKKSRFKPRSMVSTECVCITLNHRKIVKLKNPKLSHHNSGMVCILLSFLYP